MIKIKRVYEDIETGDGARLLVERLWPRGVRKDVLVMDAWLKDVAPSVALRQWFGHDPTKWAEFHQRYFEELDAHPDAWAPIMEAEDKGNVTLLYSARDTTHNNALALQEYLRQKIGRHQRSQSA